MEKITKTIDIGGIDYPLMLNLNATEQINEKFGGMEQLGDALVKPENFSAALDTVAELVVILTTQGIEYVNYFESEKLELKPLTKEAVKLLCSPYDIGKMRPILFDAIKSDASRAVTSEETDEKNSVDE